MVGEERGARAFWADAVSCDARRGVLSGGDQAAEGGELGDVVDGEEAVERLAGEVRDCRVPGGGSCGIDSAIVVGGVRITRGRDVNNKRRDAHGA